MHIFSKKKISKHLETKTDHMEPTKGLIKFRRKAFNSSHFKCKLIYNYKSNTYTRVIKDIFFNTLTAETKHPQSATGTARSGCEPGSTRQARSGSHSYWH